MGNDNMGFIILLIGFATILTPFLILAGENQHTETAVIIDKYEDEYTTLIPVSMGKAGTGVVPTFHHDYSLNTSKGVVTVSSEEYNFYNISDAVNVSVTDDGRIRRVLN